MCAYQQNNIIFQNFEGKYSHRTPVISVLPVKHITKNAERLKYISLALHSAHSPTMRKFTCKIEIVVNSEMV